MQVGIIYKYTSPSGKIYIGQTVSSNNRKNSHKHITSKTNTKFGNAIKKYGIDNLEYEEIYKTKDITLCDKDKLKTILDKLEIAYISYYDSYSNGYNCTLGGGGILGHKHSEETKRQFSINRIGNTNCLGNKHSDETKQKISKAQKGKIVSEETKLKIGNSHKKQISQYSKSGEFIKNWESIKNASEKLNIDASGIIKVCKGTRKTSGGFTWKYKI